MKPPEKYPTQKTIARDLNVSRTTVAEILGGKATHRYNEETRRKVLEAAKRLNYRPHRSAQEVRRGRSNLIGVIHFGGAYEVSRRMRYYLAQAVTEQGYDVSLVESSIVDGHEHRAVSRLLEARVEGVIIANAIEAFGMHEINALKTTGVPIVTLAGREEWGIPAVYEDIRSVMRRLVRHLANLGHRRLLLLTNQYEARTTLSRIAGFTGGIADCGGTMDAANADGGAIVGRVERILPDRGSFDFAAQAYQFMKGLIASGNLPDAILCHNDHWARGIFAAAYEAGLRIPEDLAITGFDNETFGAYAPFEFTTVECPIAREAEKTVEMMVDMIHERPLEQQQVTFPCELIIRRSCGATLQTKGHAPGVSPTLLPTES